MEEKSEQESRDKVEIGRSRGRGGRVVVSDEWLFFETKLVLPLEKAKNKAEWNENEPLRRGVNEERSEM